MDRKRIFGLGLALFSTLTLKVMGQHKSTETHFVIPIPKIKSANPNRPLANMNRDSLIYMITAFINPLEGNLKWVEGDSHSSQDWGLVSDSTVASQSYSSFQKASRATSASQTFSIFKNLLKTKAYTEVRAWHHSRYPVPDTVAELEQLYSFSKWDLELIKNSSVKGTQRLIYRNRNSFPKISIAQTLSEKGSTIRETEMIIPREDLSGQFDFYAYNEVGQLSNTSIFYSSKGKNISAFVPYTCMSCHYNSSDGVFQPLPLSYTGHNSK